MKHSPNPEKQAGSDKKRRKGSAWWTHPLAPLGMLAAFAATLAATAGVLYLFGITPEQIEREVQGALSGAVGETKGPYVDIQLADGFPARGGAFQEILVDVAVSPNGRLVAALGRDTGTQADCGDMHLKIWSSADGELVLDRQVAAIAGMTSDAVEGGDARVAFSDDGRLLALYSTWWKQCWVMNLDDLVFRTLADGAVSAFCWDADGTAVYLATESRQPTSPDGGHDWRWVTTITKSATPGPNAAKPASVAVSPETMGRVTWMGWSRDSKNLLCLYSEEDTLGATLPESVLLLDPATLEMVGSHKGVSPARVELFGREPKYETAFAKGYFNSDRWQACLFNLKSWNRTSELVTPYSVGSSPFDGDPAQSILLVSTGQTIESIAYFDDRYFVGGNRDPYWFDEANSQLEPTISESKAREGGANSTPDFHTVFPDEVMTGDNVVVASSDDAKTLVVAVIRTDAQKNETVALWLRRRSDE